MTEEYSVLLSRLVKDHELNIVHISEDFEQARIYSMAVGRPGLQFAGFFEYYDPRRMLVSGKQEHTYLERLSPEERYRSIEGLFRRRPARRLPPCPAVCGADGAGPQI